MYSVDHVYPGRNLDTAPTVVVYGEIGADEFTAAHRQGAQSVIQGEGGFETFLYFDILKYCQKVFYQYLNIYLCIKSFLALKHFLP